MKAQLRKNANKARLDISTDDSEDNMYQPYACKWSELLAVENVQILLNEAPDKETAKEDNNA